jgi:hypothetical protein
LTLEAFLESRLQQIEFAFGGKAGKPFMDFINAAEDFDERFQRVAISFATQALFAEDINIFGDATEAEFLAVVEAFQRGGEDIIDTFARVVNMLTIIAGLHQFLTDFAGSDLASDFQALVDIQNMSLAQALDAMNVGLFDAIASFDGSIESLQEIGLIVSSIREGELKLLAQIDSISKGIASNLDKLEADILGLTATPATGEEIFAEAIRLRDAIATAETPEEVARLTREFDAVIRSISPEEQILNQGPILALIESFRVDAEARLAEQRQTVIDNAAATRLMVDDFIERVGTPLDILAASNPEAVDYLRVISENTAPPEEGEEKEDIGTEITNAITSGFAGANVNVTVVIQDGNSLSTQ